MATSRMGRPNIENLHCADKLSRESCAEYRLCYAGRQVFSQRRLNTRALIAGKTQMFKIVSDLSEDGIEIRQHVRRVPRLEADELARDLPVTVNHVCLRIHRRAVLPSNRRVIVLRRRIAVGLEDYPLLVEKFFIGRGVLVGGNAENNAVPRLDVFLQTIEGGGFFDAWWAPCGPEIQYHDLALQIGQMSGLPCDLQWEVLGSLPCHGGIDVEVTGHREKQHTARRSRQCAPGRYFSEGAHSTV